MSKTTTRSRALTWQETVTTSLRRLKGEASLQDLYPVVAEVRVKQGFKLSETWQATVRRTVQQAPNIVAVRKGVWRLVDAGTTEDTASEQ
jgi:hypothetical protein